MAEATVTVNRAPALTLWAAVVAQGLGFDRREAMTLGKAVAGLAAQTKGRSLGIFKPPKLEPGKKPKMHGLGEEFWIELCGRSIPAKNTDGGVRWSRTNRSIRRRSTPTLSEPLGKIYPQSGRR